MSRRSNSPTEYIGPVLAVVAVLAVGAWVVLRAMDRARSRPPRPQPKLEFRLPAEPGQPRPGN